MRARPLPAGPDARRASTKRSRPRRRSRSTARRSSRASSWRSSTASTYDFPVWVNRCGVLAGAGQFGRRRSGHLRVSGSTAGCASGRCATSASGASGHQVRDCLHPADLVPLLERQIADERSRPCRASSMSAAALQSARSLAQLSAWCREPPRRSRGRTVLGARARSTSPGWCSMRRAPATAGTGRRSGRREDILDEILRHAQRAPGLARRLRPRLSGMARAAATRAHACRR